MDIQYEKGYSQINFPPQTFDIISVNFITFDHHLTVDGLSTFFFTSEEILKKLNSFCPFKSSDCLLFCFVLMVEFLCRFNNELRMNLQSHLLQLAVTPMFSFVSHTSVTFP